MAARRGSCYVYRIFDGPVTVYVGKGSGRRLAAQKAKFRLEGEVLEECLCAELGLSKLDVDRISEVANGPRC